MSVTTTKLLIVDDEPLVRALLGEIFRQRGHEVQTAVDGFSALRTMRSWMPDVLVSDLNMPGMSGFELLSIVRRRLAAIYVVATSGAYTGSELPEGIAADVFHEKGTGVKTLVEQIEVLSQALPAAPRGSNSTAPIWTSRSKVTASGERPAGAIYAMISCPECLRALPQVLSDEVMRIHETECMYCQTPVHYAVVQELDPETSQPFGVARQTIEAGV
ncbi:response regulator [Granulicella sp. 5B5]|uniref:response regulator n=1 Tax=Granulicella sp. 5B5 TaxID=1617967 RepID=UPI0015F664A4|nr:response regulator [Granulicella sp. 5B5]